MKLPIDKESRRRRLKGVEAVQRPLELSAYAEAISLIPDVRNKIKEDFDSPLWFSRCLEGWSMVKWLDPSFDIPDISSDQIKAKLFDYLERNEKNLSQETDEVSALVGTGWFIQAASRAMTVRPELQEDIVQKVQVHIDIVLGKLEHMEYPTDPQAAWELTFLFIHLSTFGPEVRQRVQAVVKRFESSALDLLKHMAEKELSTTDKKGEFFAASVLFRLGFPDQQTEIQDIALPKVGDFDEGLVGASGRFVVLLFKLILHSPKVTFMPSGTLDMTLPPEAAQTSKPMPERPSI